MHVLDSHVCRRGLVSTVGAAALRWDGTAILCCHWGTELFSPVTTFVLKITSFECISAGVGGAHAPQCLCGGQRAGTGSLLPWWVLGTEIGPADLHRKHAPPLAPPSRRLLPAEPSCWNLMNTLPPASPCEVGSTQLCCGEELKELGPHGAGRC